MASSNNLSYYINIKYIMIRILYIDIDQWLLAIM